MRALEVAVLDPKAGGGAMRAAIMISLRRRVERLKTVELYRSPTVLRFNPHNNSQRL